MGLTRIVSTAAGLTRVAGGGGKTALLASGPPGPAGPAGGAELTRAAAQALGGHRVVRALGDGSVNYASADEIAHAELILGVTMEAAAMGASVRVRSAGEISEGSWAWALGPVFCGLNGVLTQTPPASGFLRQIGFADAADRIIIDLKPAIIL